MAILTVSQTLTLPFHSATAIDTVKFTNTSGGLNPTAILTLSAAEFDGVHFSTALAVQASTGTNGFVINGASSLSLAGWSFVSWGRTDSITVNGTLGADSLTGSAVGDRLAGAGGNDTLRGGQGADALYGGANDDTLRIAFGDVIGAETLDGGTGIDSLLIDHGATADLRTSTLTGIEGLTFGSTAGFFDGAVTLAGSHIGGAAVLQTVTGGTQTDSLIVIGALVDLSGVSFASWSTRTDKITLSGTTGADILTGSTLADHLIGGGVEAAFVDTLSGGAGNDTLEGDKAHLYGGTGRDVFRLSDEALLTGQIINGGAGTDTIELYSVGFDTAFVGGKTLSGIEVLTIAKSPGPLVNMGVQGHQIGAAAGLINTIDLRNESGIYLEVFGPQIDLTGVTFKRYDTADFRIYLDHATGPATIIGSSLRDVATYSGGLVTFDLGSAADQLDLMAPITAGSSFQGGTGFDRVRAEGDADLTQASFAGFEEVSLTDALTFTLLGSQLAGLQVIVGAPTVNPNTTIQVLAVSGQVIDASALSFQSWGSSDSVLLTGTAAADTITGSAQGDRITGQAGADVLTGGAGPDHFLYSSAADSALGQGDTITDFVVGSDLINLTGFETTQTFIGSAAFSGGGNEVRYDAATGTLQGDLIGGGAVEWEIHITGAPGITGNDVLT